MTIAFLIIALTTLITATIAMSLRNLIHSALLLIGSWAGVAAFYLWAGAEFVAFGQALVYVGAVSMVVLFAVLLTRHSREDLGFAPDTIGRAVSALIVGGTVLGVLVGAVLSTPLRVSVEEPAAVSVHSLGLQLMGPHAAALIIVGVLLTVALLGAVVIAAADRPPERKERR